MFVLQITTVYTTEIVSVTNQRKEDRKRDTKSREGEKKREKREGGGS